MSANPHSPGYLRPARDAADAERRLEMITRARLGVATVDEYFAAVEHWNTSVRGPHESPIDADPDGEMARIRQYYARILEGEYVQ